MVTVPIPVPVTRPVESIVARVMSEEVQLSRGDERTCVLPSEKVPVAVSCGVVPLATEELGGVIVIDLSVAAVTVTWVLPVITNPF